MSNSFKFNNQIYENNKKMFSVDEDELYNIETNLNVSDGLIYTLDTGTNSYTVTNIGNCIDRYIVIPKYYNGKIVKKIGPLAFVNCTNIVSVFLPNSITSIDHHAFYNCTSLSHINIPNDVKYIGDRVFAKCTSLKMVKLPNTLTKIWETTFRSCTSLVNIDIPSAVTDISNNAFKSCTALKNITLPNITILKKGVFSGCTGLVYIKIPNSVTSIESEAFQSCVNIIVYDFSDFENIPNLKNYDAFSTSLINITNNQAILVPIGLETDWKNATNWTAISKYIKQYYAETNASNGDNEAAGIGSAMSLDITIGKYKKIKNYAFSGNESTNNLRIRSVTIQDTTTSIGDNAFEYCRSLESVIMPDTITTIGTYVFYECNNLKSIKLSNKLESIPSMSFCNCNNLKSLTIPASIQSIGVSAFNSCTSLAFIDFLNCDSNNMPSLDNNAFANNSVTVLLVSSDAYENIKSANGWKAMIAAQRVIIV